MYHKLSRLGCVACCLYKVRSTFFGNTSIVNFVDVVAAGVAVDVVAGVTVNVSAAVGVV